MGTLCATDAEHVEQVFQTRLNNLMSSTERLGPLKARAQQTSRSIQTYQGAFYGSIVGPPSGWDGMKRRCGAKSTRSSLFSIIYGGKIST